MRARAPRRLLRAHRCFARGGVLLSFLWLMVQGSVAAAQTIVGAAFIEATDRYAHGVLGDAIEWGGLAITLEAVDGHRTQRRFMLPQDHVFEDTAPRLYDLDGDGGSEVIVVEADIYAGAALAVYGPDGKITETPHIGTPNRWLAPIGAADLDGDGMVEIAYIDRPHLAKTLRIWTYHAGSLREIASLSGFTNHRIGETDIAGGIAFCQGRPEMIVATGNWDQLVALSWDGHKITRRNLGPDTSRTAFNQVIRCQIN